MPEVSSSCILITDPISSRGVSILEAAGLEVCLYPDGIPDSGAENDLIRARGWIVRSGTTITADLLDQVPHLEVIGRAGVGVDNIDITAATRKGVVIMNTPDVNTISAAEQTLALMLALSRNIPQGDASLHKGQWIRHELVGSEMRGKTLGIVGLGKIGQEVMQRARGFSMQILGYDPYLRADMFHENEVTLVDLDQLTRESDIITVHVPLLDSTRDLFDLARLKMMKSTARIVNVARGGIINENDLATALREGIIAGAAVDVFTREPIPEDHPLLNAPNCILTPHLGASTREAKEGVSVAICEQVRDYLQNQTLTNALNLPVSDMEKLQQIQPSLDLAEILGSVSSQWMDGAVDKVQVELAGAITETKPVLLAFLKGLMQERISDRVNFINAETMARERGIELSEKTSSASGSFTNLVKTTVESDGEFLELVGSVFDDHRLRIVGINGYEMELTPRGHMLFIRNKDIPGVIGKVGTLLGSHGVNINAYLLSSKESNGEAFSVIRVDSDISQEIFKKLRQLPEIIDVRQGRVSLNP